MNVDEAEGAMKQSTETRCLESPKYTCTLGGVLATITNVYRAIPIIHAGAGCGSNQMLSFRSGGGHQGVGYVGGMLTPSTNLAEDEVVFGGEAKLRNQIKATIELMDGDLYVVADGCIAGMIGDDVDAIVREFDCSEKPVVSVKAAGFSGNTYTGYENVLGAIINQVLKPIPKERGLVNLIGFIPYQDIFWRGNLREIKIMLNTLGLTVNQFIGDFSGLVGLKQMAAAELTIVVSPWLGISVAKKLEEVFNIPYLCYPNLPVGPKESSEFIRAVGKKLNIPDVEVESIILTQEREAYYELDLAGDVCSTYASALPFAIIAGSATAVGITRFLTNEAGFTPTLVIINDDPPADIRPEIIKRLQGMESGISPKIIFEVDSYYIRKHLKQSNYKVLLASSQERYLAQDERAVFVSVSFPANDRMIIRDTYAGYGGGIAMIEDIMSRFIQPY